MNQKDARRRFDQILNEGEAATGSLRTLIRDCEPIAGASASEPFWQREAAEVFISRLRREAEAGLPEEGSAESRERLDEAILQGPAALASFQSELEGRIRDAERPLADLEILRARLRCQQLRRRCLDHLDAIFGAQRAQP